MRAVILLAAVAMMASGFSGCCCKPTGCGDCCSELGAVVGQADCAGNCGSGGDCCDMGVCRRPLFGRSASCDTCCGGEVQMAANISGCGCDQDFCTGCDAPSGRIGLMGGMFGRRGMVSNDAGCGDCGTQGMMGGAGCGDAGCGGCGTSGEGILSGGAGGCGKNGCGLGGGRCAACLAALHQRGTPYTPEFAGPAGPVSPTYGYPYYTTRGPRDFLMPNPPSIGW